MTTDNTPVPASEYPILEQYEGFSTEEQAGHIDYYVPGISHAPLITVYKPLVRFGHLDISRVNWYGCGSRSGLESEAFAAALAHASATALRLDNEAFQNEGAK